MASYAYSAEQAELTGGDFLQRSVYGDAIGLGVQAPSPVSQVGRDLHGDFDS